jgi:hypothetical protein
VLPFQRVPGTVVRVLEPDPADVAGVHAQRPAARVLAAIGAGLVAVAVQRRSVVAQPADLHAVVLDGAPFHLEEVEDEVRAVRDLQEARAGGAVGEHLQRAKLKARHLGQAQTVVWLPVVALGGPLADDPFQLVQEVERLLLRVLSPSVDVRPLVAGQRGQQLLTESPEEALESGLVGGLVDAGGLDRDAQPGARAHQVLRQVDLPVVDHDGLRRDRRQQRRPVRAGEPGRVDDHLAGQPVKGRAGICPPGRGLGQRPDRLEQHRGRVDRLGRYRGQPQPGDASVEQVHRDRQLGLDPAQCHRVHREHVQPRCVQQQVLTRPRRLQPSVGRGRAAGDLPPGLRPAECGRALGDLPQQGPRPGPARQRHRPGAVLGVQPGRGPGQDEVPGRGAGVSVLGQHRAGHRQPPGIGPALRCPAAQVPLVGQPGRAVPLQAGRPPLHGPHPHLHLGCLGLIPLEPAGAGRVLRPRLAGQGKVRAAPAVAGACLPHVSHPLPQLRQLGIAQAGQPQPRVRGPLRHGGVPDAGAGRGQQVADAHPAQPAGEAGEQHAGRRQLGDLPRLPVVGHAGAGAQLRARAVIHRRPPARCRRQGGGAGQ